MLANQILGSTVHRSQIHFVRETKIPAENLNYERPKSDEILHTCTLFGSN